LNLRREHADAVLAQATSIERLVGPILKDAGTPAPATAAPAPAVSWQASTEDLFQAARRSDVLLAGLLAGSATAVQPADLPAQLQARLAELLALATAYDTMAR